MKDCSLNRVPLFQQLTIFHFHRGTRFRLLERRAAFQNKSLKKTAAPISRTNKGSLLVDQPKKPIEGERETVSPEVLYSETTIAARLETGNIQE